MMFLKVSVIGQIALLNLSNHIGLQYDVEQLRVRSHKHTGRHVVLRGHISKWQVKALNILHPIS